MAEKPGLSDPLLVHEASLVAKVGRNSEAGEIVEQQLHLLGTQLVSQLNVLLRTVRSHGGANSAVDRPVRAILTLVQVLGAEQPVALRVQEGFVFLGERHLKTTTHQMPIFASFIDSLAALGIGEIAIKRSVTDAELRTFAELFTKTLPSEDAFETLAARVSSAGFGNVTLEPPRILRKDSTVTSGVARGTNAAGRAQAQGSGQIRERARGAYARAASALGTLNESARGGGTIHFRHAKRAIQNIVDLLLKDAATVIGLTTLRSHDAYTQNHSVNVAVLAMALANRVGYAKVELADLGLAALFHDVGKCAVPLDVLNKPGDFTPDEWATMRTHPSEGVLALLAARGLDRVPARMAEACFEHHLGYDGGGYPAIVGGWKQSLSSQVICIADCYDAMTSARVYRREPLAPPNVLRFMLSRSGTAFSPALLRIFVTSVGMIPIGTLVLLDTGELGAVLRPAPGKEHADRPTVRLIAGADGTRFDPAPEYDLREQDAEGAWVRSIVRLIDNTEYHVETCRWLITPPAI